MEEGFVCISTLNRFDELKRFLTFFQKHNSKPIHVLIARDIADAHRIKTKIAFHTPFPLTVFLDTDMMVNGNLDELFDTALDGKIGIVRERGVKCLNSGMLVFPKEAMKLVCKIWNERYELKIKKGYSGGGGTWDQDILNNILPGFPHRELSSIWNHIIKDVSPEEELQHYDEVKIFHFIHEPGIPREKYKSYQEFMKI